MNEVKGSGHRLVGWPFISLISTIALYILLLWTHTVRTWLWFGDQVDLYPVARGLRLGALSISSVWDTNQLRYFSYGLFILLAAIYVAVVITAHRQYSNENDDAHGYRQWVIIPYFTLGLVVFLFFPHFSRPTDIADYAMQARVQVIYGENPYIVPGIEYADEEPLARFMEAKERPSVYGPVWQVLSFTPALAAQGRPITTFVAFKAFFYLIGLASLGLIWRYHRHEHEPGQRSYAVLGGVAVAWNPILHLKSHGSGHNDIAMAVLMVLALVLYSERKRIWSYGAWGLASLTKFVTVPLLLPMIVGELRMAEDRRRAVLTIGAGLILASVLTTVMVLPFGIENMSGVILGRYSDLTAAESTSKASLVSALLTHITGLVRVTLPEQTSSLLVGLSLPIFWLMYTAVRALTVDSVNQLVKVSIESVLVWITFVSMPVYAQYAVTPVLLMGLLKEGKWHRIAVITVSLALMWDSLLLTYPPSPIPTWERGLHLVTHLISIGVVFTFWVFFLLGWTQPRIQNSNYERQ